MEPERAGLAALSSLDDPVRRRLYEFVAGRDEPAGRDEAAAAAGIGRPLAAYHLDKLVEQGLLTASYARPPGRGGPGAGRPAKVYARSGAEFSVTIPPREYELAAGLLAAAVEADRDGHCRAALREAARRYGAAAGAQAAADAGPGGMTAGPGGMAGPAGAGTACPGAGGDAERAQAVLRRHGFAPWQDAHGIIRLRNCPFRGLAVRHAELVCGMNLALIGGILAGLGADELRPALQPGQGCCCVIIETPGGPS